MAPRRAGPSPSFSTVQHSVMNFLECHQELDLGEAFPWTRGRQSPGLRGHSPQGLPLPGGLWWHAPRGPFRLGRGSNAPERAPQKQPLPDAGAGTLLCLEVTPARASPRHAGPDCVMQAGRTWWGGLSSGEERLGPALGLGADPPGELSSFTASFLLSAPGSPQQRTWTQRHMTPSFCNPFSRLLVVFPGHAWGCLEGEGSRAPSSLCGGILSTVLPPLLLLIPVFSPGQGGR